MKHRTQYGTFQLRTDAQGVEHLEGGLPEVIAVGYDALREFIAGEPPLGGPHAEFTPKDGWHPARLHVTTPEAEFTYEIMSKEQDKDGWFVLARLVFTSSTYHAFLAGH